MSQEPNLFWKKVGFIFSGTALAQAIPLLGSLLIARIYAPTEFGVFAAWLGVVSVAAIVLTGRFEAALAVVPDGEPRRLAACATFIVAAGVAVLAGAALLLVRWLLPSLFVSFTIGLIWLLVPASFAMACTNIWQYWAAAEGRLRLLAAIRIVQACAITGAQIIIGYMAPNAIVLAGGYFGGVILTVLWAAAIMPLRRNEQEKLEWREAMQFWSAYRRFPLLALPADSINTIAAQLPIFILATRFGTEVAGYFALAMRVLGAPISLLGTAVLDVFKRVSATSFREQGHCREDYRRTFRVLATGAVFATIILISVSEFAFTFFFGEQWREAGVFAVWLMPMFAFRFVASPLSYVFYITNKQHVDLGWQVALLLVTMFSLYFPRDHITAIQAYSTGYSGLYVFYLWLSWYFSKGVKKNDSHC